MKSLLRSFKGTLYNYYKQAKSDKVEQFVSKYVKDNNLDKLIIHANDQSNSTGVADSDYVLLHKLIRTKKPKYVLECGTGRSTWVIAHALWQNHNEFGIAGKVVSMESVQQWYDEAIRIFPKEYAAYADIRVSAPTTFMYSFIKGTCYAEVPDLPYEVVFVDGPIPATLIKTVSSR